jgi:cytochrome o ubiquinol oxidase subunit 2
MSNKTKITLMVLLALGVLLVSGIYLSRLNIAVLQPAGPVGQKEKNLIVFAVLLSLIVIIPVYVMLIGFAWKYRASNKSAKYSPNLNGSRLLESIWWGVPLILIIILGAVTWRSSHDLDPFRPLSSSRPPITIQVVALDWRWLFIYPQQKVATINYFKMPVNQPVTFQITSDAPMNSFWIPQLGGQIYAMSGMATHLNLLASRAGDFKGVSANISGEGFADMHFMALAVDSDQFTAWMKHLQAGGQNLDLKEYNKLAMPTRDTSLKSFGQAQPGLFDQIIAKYQAPVYFAPQEASL